MRPGSYSVKKCEEMEQMCSLRCRQQGKNKNRSRDATNTFHTKKPQTLPFAKYFPALPLDPFI